MFVHFEWRRCVSRLKYRVPTLAAILDHLTAAPVRDTESRALQIIACRNRTHNSDILLRAQNPSGAWSAEPNAGPDNCFHTALALLALKALLPNDPMPQHVAHAFAWLDSIVGVENHWLWKWKFRYFDRQVRFDPTKTGWPWVEGTVSWVAPTAMVMLAYRAWTRGSPRLLTATRMLMDRACPQGGWNAGNSEVFGVALDPHPDFTAMALLALRGVLDRNEAIIAKSLDYLPLRLKNSESLYSLAWGALALNAWSHAGSGDLTRRLRVKLTTIDPSLVPVRTLALAVIACEPPSFLKYGGHQ